MVLKIEQSPAAAHAPAPPAWAKIYSRWRGSSLGRITDRLEHDALRRVAGPLRDRLILDAGCGDGTWALALTELGANVIGLDASWPMLRQARARAAASRQNLALVQARTGQLPFAGDRFEAAFAVTVLCHERDPLGVLRETARVLRPGGRLIVAELGPWSPWALWRVVRAWLGSALWRGAEFRSARRWRRMLDEAGLPVEESTGAVFYPPAAWAARFLEPWDRAFARSVPSFGALLLFRARKPHEPSGLPGKSVGAPTLSAGDR